MNTRQIQYAIKLSKTLNFSQVADQLNISQPALSKQILSLENELGVKLFDRSVTPMCLTPAGEYFIREAEELLYQEDQLVRSMSKYRSGEAGQLVIGITPFRSSYMIPHIVKKVQEKFPNVKVRLHEAGSDVLRAEVLEGRYDFAVVNLPVEDSMLNITPLEQDQLVLLVPSNLKGKLPEGISDEDDIDFSVCKDFPFAVVGHTQEMRVLFERLCASADFRPNIAVEVVSLTTAWAMARSGVAATILPFQFVKGNLLGTDVHVFRIKNAVYIRQPAIVTRRGQHISDSAAYAMNLLTDNAK